MNKRVNHEAGLK